MDLINKEWDVIVVGTGMSGAACGFRLAQSGKSVLFCEKGKSHLKNTESLQGKYAEEYLDISEKDKDKKREVYKNSGRWFDEIEDHSGKKKVSYLPFAGMGTGGSSTLFGMVMQRFYPDDFNPGKNFKNATEANLPEKWPISYEDLRPYYSEMEKLFNVQGQIDPLRKDSLDPIKPRSTIPQADFAHELSRHFESQGKHPYQPPLACDFVDDCKHCQGFICKKNCKNDSAKIFLKPALDKYGASCLDECAVLKLEHEGENVKRVICRWKNRDITLKAKVVILASGSFETPNILLHSASKDYPNGLANRSGMVGKNLMRNLYDLYFVSPKIKMKIKDGAKEIYLNDFYTKEEGKLGILQSFGHLSPKAMVDGLEGDLEISSFSIFLPLFRRFKPWLFKYFKKKLASVYILVSTMEDMPYLENRIIPAKKPGGKMGFFYRPGDFDKKRISLLRTKIKKMLKPYKFTLVKQAEQSKNFIALACGTCRFGNDPKTSVLDKNNLAHGIQNLYVIDGSFFPSNPGLNSGHTIAANALRVADKILERQNLFVDDYFEAVPKKGRVLSMA